MNLTDRVRTIVATTLRQPLDNIGPATEQKDISTWDSLAHVNLMMSLEQEFDIMLDVEDFARLTSMAAILDYLHEHADA